MDIIPSPKGYKTLWNTVVIEWYKYWLQSAYETYCSWWPPGRKIPFYVGIVLTAAKHEDEEVAAADLVFPGIYHRRIQGSPGMFSKLWYLNGFKLWSPEGSVIRLQSYSKFIRACYVNETNKVFQRNI